MIYFSDVSKVQVYFFIISLVPLKVSKEAVLGATPAQVSAKRVQLTL